MNAIELTNVVKRYGRVDALRGVSFTVERGEMFGLIGPDGAGKTTAIRAMCGLLHIESGSIRVLGKDPAKQHRDITASIGYLSAFLALRRSQHRRKHRLLRADSRRARFPRAARPSARD